MKFKLDEKRTDQSWPVRARAVSRRLSAPPMFWKKPPARYNNNDQGNYLSRQLDVIIERDEEGYYVASVPQIPGCHTQARSLDEVTQRIREAIELCLEVVC